MTRVLFLAILLSLFSKNLLSHSETNVDKSIIITDTKQIIYKDVGEYVEESFDKMTETIDEDSGFLGWRNIRDYLGFGKQTLKSRVKKAWSRHYKQKRVTQIIKKNMNDAFVALDVPKERIRITKIDSDPVIDIYSNKIAISVFFLLVEELFEYVLGYGIAVFCAFLILYIYLFYQFTLGGWIRWSKNRRDKVKSLNAKIWLWSRRAFSVLFFIWILFQDDWAHSQMEKQIKKEIVSQVQIQVDNNFNTIVND